MFNLAISETVMVSSAANHCYRDKICGDGYDDDRTFLSTMRALLGERIKDDIIFLSHKEFSLSSGAIDGTSVDGLNNYVKDRVDDCNTLTVAYFGGRRDANDKLYAHIEKHFAEVDGWVRIPGITDFFKRSFDVLCFVCETRKSSVLFVRDINMKKYHQLQICTLTALPWYFNPKQGDRISDLERELLQSLQEQTPDHYLDVLQRISSKCDFRAKFIHDSLQGIETVYERQQIDVYKREIERLERTIAEMQDTIDTTYNLINEKSITLLGLQTKLANNDGSSVLVDYFMSNKNLCLDRSSGSDIVFHVNTVMAYFDPEIAERYLDNNSSFFYACSPSEYEIPLVKRFFSDIFLYDKIRIRMCAAYKMNINGTTVARANYNFGSDAVDRLPNPHIQSYGCIGNYERRFNELAAKRDYVGILETATASAMSLNISDSVVMGAFVRQIFSGAGGKCFIVGDKQMGIGEVIEYVRKEMEEEANE